jgi:hypothetical protein
MRTSKSIFLAVRGGRAVLVVVLVLAGLVVSVSPAAGEASSPWFRLASVSRPGNLAPASLVADEVQEVTVAAAKGDFYLEDPVTKVNDEFPPLPFDATPAEVQTVLEGFYGAGNVDVSSKPVSHTEETEHVRRYLIRFVGGLADHPVALVVPRSLSFTLFGFAPLTGGEKGGVAVEGEGAVEAGQLTEGAFKGSEIVVTAVNVGDEGVGFETATDGVPLQITDTLPAGLKALFIEGEDGGSNLAQCELGTLTCTFSNGGLSPFVQRLEVRIAVAVEAGASSGELNTARLSGGEGFACHAVTAGTGQFSDADCLREAAGGNFQREATGPAPGAHVSHPVTVSGSPTPFGVEDYEMTDEETGGTADTHAGSHPFQTTFTLNLNEALTPSATAKREVPVPAALAKDLAFKLPAGWIGDPSAYPHCTLGEFSEEPAQCPAGSIIGVAYVVFHEEKISELSASAVPVYNMEPSVGEPARIGFKPAGVPVFIDTSVRTGEDYGITAKVQNIPQTVGFIANTVTLWGDPGDARHNDARGGACLEELKAAETHAPCNGLEASDSPPYLSLPTSCTGPLESSAEGDSWEQPGPLEPLATDTMPGLDGCGSLQFASEIKVSPDVPAGSTPSGLTADVHVPQEEALNANGFAPADVKNITVTLPEGLVLNPAAADGLEACSQQQVGLDNSNEAACPNASKIASATIKTPLLPAGQYLHGFVYLASPQNFSTLTGAPPENPFQSLVAMYLVVKDPISGVLVKLAGDVSLSPAGQITTTFANNPQLPFEDAEIEFFGGERAPLATPAHCGSYTTSATFEPWTNTSTIHEALNSTSTFDITSGPGGTPCPGAALPFTPTLQSGTTNINAGAFTPLTTTLSREDGQQSISSVVLHYPPGVSGMLTGVALCSEANANAGTCGPESLIGETVVSVGLGGDPFTVTGGKAYLTEKYAGAPFGLSIVNPAKAGPFDLQEGRPVIVRAKVEIDPHTAAMTVTTDPPGTPHAIPTILEGIPLQIKHVNVNVTRPKFTFNPTSCEPQTITGAIDSAEGASSPLQVPFQVTNCAALKFTPTLKVTVAGHASKLNGAALTFKVAYPPNKLGTQSWFNEAKFDIPKQLPARLETLQRACLAHTFETNRAACPPASVIGHVTVHTPVLPVPLTGPIYFVSYGSQKFPEAVQVLQGYGITIELHGETFINKTTGVTSATFKNLPDVPFENIEVTVPTGRYSEFGANLPTKDGYNFCGQNLKMPVLFKAANGTTINQNTPITITNCKTKPHTKHKTTKKHH